MINVTGDIGYFCTVTTQDSFRDLCISINEEPWFPYQEFLMLCETYSLAHIISWFTNLGLMANMKNCRELKSRIKTVVGLPSDPTFSRHESCCVSKRYFTWPSCRTIWSSVYSCPAKDEYYTLWWPSKPCPWMAGHIYCITLINYSWRSHKNAVMKRKARHRQQDVQFLEKLKLYNYGWLFIFLSKIVK